MKSPEICKNCKRDIQKVAGRWYHGNGLWYCSTQKAEPKEKEQ